VLTTCFYEFCHCIQHLSYKPKNAWLVAMKARHMAHHFHDESGNFGITNFVWDRLFGTFYERVERPERSATVFNLGYTEDVAAVYPWVARLSGGVASGHPRQRDRVPAQDVARKAA
jgi:sterol desaturase/sphingolipid hydroxylase (fatty acid hydroxylase superfamily)